MESLQNKCTLSFELIVEAPPDPIEVQVNAEGDTLWFKEATLLGYEMTPSEVALCRALLQHDYILVADNVPRLPHMRELAEQGGDVAVIHVTAYSERHKQRFCHETPITKSLLKDGPETGLPFLVDMILEGVAQMDEDGPFFRADL